MLIAVAGGNGTLGRPVAERLRESGHEVRVLGRSSREHPVDLRTGAGLVAALHGCDVVVDAANAAGRSAAGVLVEGSQRLLDAGARAGVAHHVCASIVGIDDVPLGYYRTKLRQEATVTRGAQPWTIVRATQFHTLLAGLFAATARFGVVPSGRARLQPVDPVEVADVVAEVAAGEPRRARVTVAGPEVRELGELAREWRGATGRRALALRVPSIGKAGAALRAGRLTDEHPDHRGSTTFAQWLQAA